MERVSLTPLTKAAPAVVLLVFIAGVATYATTLPLASYRAQLTAAVFPTSVLSLTNSHRLAIGLPALSESSTLSRAAQMKAEDMAREGYYAHVSPDGETPMHWLNAAGYNYTLVGENLVVDRNDAVEAVSAWMNSPGHRINILRPDFSEIGIGVAKGTYKGRETTFVVQMFASPKKTVVVAPKPVPVQPAAVPVATKPAPVTPTPAVKPVAPKPTAKPILPAIKPAVAKPAVTAPAVSATTTATTTVATSTATSTTQASAEVRARPVVLTTQEVPVWSAAERWQFDPNGAPPRFTTLADFINSLAD